MPSGLERIEAVGASFARPSSWRVTTNPPGSREGPDLSIQATTDVGQRTPVVSLKRTGPGASDFKVTVETRRDLDGSDGLAGAEEVDVPGAKQALLFGEQRTLEGNPFEFFELAL